MGFQHAARVYGVAQAVFMYGCCGGSVFFLFVPRRDFPRFLAFVAFVEVIVGGNAHKGYADGDADGEPKRRAAVVFVHGGAW